jgi:hypothetical protein
MDTHMFRLCRALGLLDRARPDLNAAREATAAFRRMWPEDPVRYDFALTRLGIRDDADPEEFLAECAALARAPAAARADGCRPGLAGGPEAA